MPFGLKNASAIFQRVMDIMLSRVKSQFGIVYLHNRVIFSGTLYQHIDHTRLLLSLFKDSGLTLELKECAFPTNKIKYPRFTKRPGRLEV